MKYLKKYNESVSFDYIRSEIEMILQELEQDFGFSKMISKSGPLKLAKGEIFNYIKVIIFKKDRFEYSQIEEAVERLKDFMRMNNYQCSDFSSYFGPGGEKQPKIVMDLRRQFNRFGEGEWSESAYSFEISFVAVGVESLDEKLKSDSYKSAAEQLTKLGHKKRPEELMKWYEIIKKREDDVKKKKTIEDAKQLGVYQCKLGFSKSVAGKRESKELTGNFYLRLQYDSWQMDDIYNDFKNDGGNLWMSFSIGLIPVGPEEEQYCQEVLRPILGVGSDGVTYWLGCLWVNLTENNEPGDLAFRPTGKANIECYEGNFHLTNRASAIQLKKKLLDFFYGDLIINETPQCPGGEKERIIDDLCNDRGHDIYEIMEVAASIQRVNLNKLYKD
jgi:hypothetical protein